MKENQMNDGPKRCSAIRVVLFDLGNTLIHEKVDNVHRLDELALRLMPHAKEALESLAPAYIMGLVTNTETSGESAVRSALQKLGVDHYLKAVVTSVDLKVRKPNPEIFRQALSRLHASPDEAVMVGNDRLCDICGARSVGIITIYFRPGAPFSFGKSRSADYCIHSLSELAPLLSRINESSLKADSKHTEDTKDKRREWKATIRDDDIRNGYLTTIQLAIYDGQLSWQITGTYVQVAILLVAGSVFPSFVGPDEQRSVMDAAALLVSLAGILMTGMFGSMILRIRAFEEYWILRATQLEESFGDSVETLRGSATLARTGLVTTSHGSVRMPRVAGVKSKLMLASLFGSFLLTFIALAAANVWRLALALTIMHAVATSGNHVAQVAPALSSSIAHSTNSGPAMVRNRNSTGFNQTQPKH